MTDAPPAVSVVVPTHGRPDLLRDTVDAVLAQTLPPVELWVVDDVGDTGLEHWLTERLAGSGVGGGYLHRTDGAPGASASRNAGAARTTGTWLAFCDDDDLWPAGYLEAMTDRLTATGARFAVAPLVQRSAAGEVPGRRMREGLTVADVVARNPGLTGSNVVVERELFRAVAGFDETLPVSNDLDLLVRLLGRGARYAVAADTQVVQRRHGGAQLTAWNRRRADGLRAYARKHQRALRVRGRIRIEANRAAIMRRISPHPLARVAWTGVQLLGVRPAALRERFRERRLGGEELWR